jgi:hypothetical protein
MKRRIIFISCGLLIIGIATFFYIDTVFLPGQFKQFIITKAEKSLRREVSIGNIDFRPIKGFLIENITIARKDDPNRPFIQIKEVEFNLLFAPIFQKQAIILPHIKIKDPYIYLSRDETRTWNFSDLPSLEKILKRNSSFSVLLRKLDLKGGEIQYIDKTQAEEFSETIKNIEINTTLSLNKGARFILKAEVPKHKTLLTIKGNYALVTKKMTAQILVDHLYLARYHPLLQASRPYIGLDDGMLSSADFRVTYKGRELQAQGAFVADQMNIRVGEDRHIDGTIHVPEVLLMWRDKKWDAKGRIQLPSVHMTASGDKEFRGDVKAELNLLTIFGNNMTGQGDVTVDNAGLSLGKDIYLKGNIAATNASLVKGDGRVHLQGNFDIKKAAAGFGEQASFEGSLSTKDTKLTWLLDDARKQTLDIQSGLTMDGARITLGADRSISGNIAIHQANVFCDETKVAAEVLGRIDKADIQLGEGKNYLGDPYFNISFNYDPKNKDPVDYKGTVRFTSDTLGGIPHVERIDGIGGTVAVMPDHLQADDLVLNTQGTEIRLSGSLTNFSDPALDIRASSKIVKLEKVLELFPALAQWINAELTGEAAVDISYNGPMRSPADAAIGSTVQLTNANFIHEKLPDAITGISGRLFYGKDSLRWQDLRGYYLEEPYTLNGKLDNFSRPVIDTQVTGDRLKLNAQINVLRSAFQLNTFTGSYLGSSFDLKGDVHLLENDETDIDLRGNFALNLMDIGFIVPYLRYHVQRLSPTGILTGEGVYKGKINDWRNWQLSIDARSDRITLKGYPFENAAIRITQRDLTISKSNVSARIYGGNLVATSSADLRDDKVPFNIMIDLKNLDLAQLRQDKKPKNRQLAGILSGSAALEGKGKEWRKMTGRGSVNIIEGHIWQWDILDGMANALLIPEFKNLVFTQAYGDFFVRDQKILTNNTRMTSKSATLDAKGWIDFGAHLNFDITPKFSQLDILKSGSLKKGPTSIITQTDGYLNIKLTGTLGRPNIYVEKSPMKIIGGTIGNTTGTIKEVIGGIVEEIF